MSQPEILGPAKTVERPMTSARPARYPLALSLLLLAPHAWGQQFGPAQQLTGRPSFPDAAVAADLDGDGDLDLLVPSGIHHEFGWNEPGFSADTIVWYENIDGAGTFGTERFVAGGAAGTRSASAADLDGDGDLDVLSASWFDDKLAWYENTDGLGNFGPQRILSKSADGAVSISAADLDGDGDQDVLSASFFDDEVAWRENLDGLGNFGPPQAITTAVDGPTSVLAADLDGDGDPDLVTSSILDAQVPGWQGKLAWYENTGGGSFGPQQVVTTAASDDSPNLLEAADVDGDGDLDLLSSTSSSVVWYPNTDGLGSFGAPATVVPISFFPYGLDTADLDGDGDLDVLKAGLFGESLTWAENLDGLGSFAIPKLVVAFSGNSHLADVCVLAEDFDGDGDPDVLGINQDDTRIRWTENTDGFGSFATPVDVFSPWYWGAAAHAADLDGDGDLDVIGAPSPDEPTWFENTDGAGNFVRVQGGSSSPSFIFSAVAADLDGDGDQDLLTSSIVADTVAWHANTDGAGKFGPEQIITLVADGARDAIAADLDGDGDLDVIAASELDNELAWYENLDGMGSFGFQNLVSNAALRVRSVWAADVDGDGDQDLLSASYVDDKIAWYENTNGLGSFGLQQVVSTTGDGPHAVRAADLDGDGDLDALASSSKDGVVAWYANTNALGSFGAQQIVSDAYLATGIATGDLDGDGDLDVLASVAEPALAPFFTIEYPKLVWNENQTGLGDFGPIQDLAASATAAGSVVTADFDGDGDRDVLGATTTGGRIAWHANLGAALQSNVDGLSLASGGSQQLSLTAPPEYQSRPYMVLGTFSGTTPGIPWENLVVPLNFDGYFLFTLNNPNSALLEDTLGLLSVTGTATAAWKLPAATAPGLVGTTLHHAFGVVDFGPAGRPAVVFVSNAVPVTLLP